MQMHLKQPILSHLSSRWVEMPRGSNKQKRGNHIFTQQIGLLNVVDKDSRAEISQENLPKK